MSDNFVMPDGRLINGHLFVRTVYTDDKGREGNPMYKAEMAYPKTPEGAEDGPLSEFESYLWGVMVEAYGEEIVNARDEAGQIRWPIKDGDKLAARRKEKGKAGDAYEGMDVVRASTRYNHNGDDAEGGIEVYDEAVEAIPPVKKSEVYNGSMGVMVVRAKAYDGTDPSTDDPYISCTLYLESYQKVGEGERLQAQTNRSGLFKKRAQSQGAAAGGGKGGGRRGRS